MPLNHPDHNDGLAHYLCRMIRTSGPITVERYMAEALGNPKYGYYTTQNPIGATGDFITAPEVSQMFGELIGLWCADAWQHGGSPSPVHMVEIGPGRGTLMRDAIRASHALPAFQESIGIHLVETSPVLRACQRDILKDAHVTWHERFDELPPGPVLVIANELFDALPIHQFERTVRGWRERMVDLTTDGQRFRFVLGPLSGAFALVSETIREAPLGSVAEVSPACVRLMHEIAERVVGQGGAALIIDYGSAVNRPRETLQAVFEHRRHEVLDAPGNADLCAHVDFATLAQTATEVGAAVWGPVLQGEFLESLGIESRAAQLKHLASAQQSVEIDTALERLTRPGQMGSLFKVLAISAPGIRGLSGFENSSS